jgi:hypothetical protein
MQQSTTHGSDEPLALRFEISKITLRRRLAAGDLPGARKEVSPRGTRWLIPVGAIEALGVSERPVPEEPTVEELLHELDLVRERLAKVEAIAAERADALEDLRRIIRQRDP